MTARIEDKRHPSTLTEFTVVRDVEPNGLAAKVRDHLDRGWAFHGDPFIRKHLDDGWCVCQAMVRGRLG